MIFNWRDRMRQFRDELETARNQHRMLEIKREVLARLQYEQDRRRAKSARLVAEFYADLDACLSKAA